MFELLIWLIIVAAVFISKSKKAQEKIGEKATQVFASKPVQEQKKNFAVMPEHKKVPPNVERKCAAEDRHRSENNVYQKKTSQTTAVPNVKRAYTEAPMQTRMEKRSSRMIAKRLYEGDHVPQGYRMVKCGYCAAENLIAYSSRGDYMCYFCHEDL